MRRLHVFMHVLVHVLVAAGVTAIPVQRVAAQSTITGSVFDSLRTQAPLAGATVVLLENSRYAVTDRRGQFRFDSVAPGRYTLGVLFGLLDTLGVQLPARSVEVSTRQTRVDLAVPSARSLHAALCPGVREPETGVVFGRISDVDDAAPVAGATVSTTWAEFTVGASGSRREEQRGAVPSQASGVYVLCNVPLDVTLDIVVNVNGRGAGPVSVSLDNLLLHHLDLAISRADSAARAIIVDRSVLPVNTLRGTSTLTGRVLDARGRPLSTGVLRIKGTDRTSRTDSTGAFRLGGIPAGTREVEVRAVGVAPSEFALAFETGKERDTVITLDRQVQALAGVTVQGEKRPRDYRSGSLARSGFSERQKQGLGAFMTEEMIKSQTFPDLAALLRTGRGVTMLTDARLNPIPYLRSGSSISGNVNGRCLPNYYLDGARFEVDVKDHPFSTLNDLVLPQFIKAVEIYASAGTIPALFDNTALTDCGSIVIWTR